MDVVTLILFRVYSWRPFRQAPIELLFRLAGSLWLLWLQTCSTVRSRFLLRAIGTDLWCHGWERLWSGPALYVGVRARLAHSSVGTHIYVGESVCFRRRCTEHVLRLLKPAGHTQQPVYSVIRQGLTNSFDVAVAVSEWFFFPLPQSHH